MRGKLTQDGTDGEGILEEAGDERMKSDGEGWQGCGARNARLWRWALGVTPSVRGDDLAVMRASTNCISNFRLRLRRMT